jgi:hypothetical protein
MSEEYPCDRAERLWPDWLARFKPIGVLPRVDFVPADADPTDRFLALLHATPSEFQSTFMPDPIPLSERKPGPDDFKNGQAWYGQEQPFGDQDTWDWCYTTPGYGEGSSFTHWLPASTKYLPARVEG